MQPSVLFMFIIFNRQLPTCAMFLLPEDCKSLWSDTQVSATKSVTSNGSMWWEGKKEEKILQHLPLWLANTVQVLLNVCLALPSTSLVLSSKKRIQQPAAICGQTELLTFAHPKEQFGELTSCIQKEALFIPQGVLLKNACLW